MWELNAVAPWEYALETEGLETHRHSRNRIKEPTADEALKEFCREFPYAGLRRDWTFVTDNVNQCLGKERERNKKYWCSRARTLNISNNPKNKVPIISDGSRPEADVLWEIFPKALPEGFYIDWSYIHKAMKANGYCPILYKKDGTQLEHKKHWGGHYGNEAKDRLGVKKLNCTPSRKQKKPTVICDGDKIILHIPFGFKDDDSDTSEGVLTKYKKYAESSNDGSFAESSDSRDEECGKKRSRKKSPKHKTKQKKS